MSLETAAHTVAVRRRPTLVLVCLGAALGGLIFGYDTSVLNSAESAVAAHFGLGAAMRGVMTSISLLGCAVGAAVAGSLSERYGRTRVMLAAAWLYCGAVLVAGLAPTIEVLLIGRALTGVGIGAASVMVPAYIAEVAPARSRGKLGSLQQLLITFGILVALLVGLGTARGAGGAADVWWFGLDAWRWIVLSAIVPGALYGLAALRLPESPRYLVSRGRDEQAVTVFAWVSGVDEATARLTVAEIRGSLGQDPPSSFRALRGSALGLKPIVWAGIGVAIFMQVSGINAVFVYSSSLWRSVGFSESGALTVSIVTAVINILVTVIAVAVADRFPRRAMLMTGSAGSAVSLGVAALAFAQATSGPGEDLVISPGWGVVALVGVNLMVVFFGMTWGPLGWVLLGEMFPNSLRAAALAVATTTQWVATYAVVHAFPVMEERLGLAGSYAVFAAMAALSFVFVWRALPETKGKTLEQMTASART